MFPIDAGEGTRRGDATGRGNSQWSGMIKGEGKATRDTTRRADEKKGKGWKGVSWGEVEEEEEKRSRAIEMKKLSWSRKFVEVLEVAGYRLQVAGRRWGPRSPRRQWTVGSGHCWRWCRLALQSCLTGRVYRRRKA